MTQEQATAPAPVVCTVAGPRRPISHEIYNGAELTGNATRPGAYDALRIPSLFNGRRQAPHAPVEPSTVWTPPPPTPRALRTVDAAPLSELRPQILAVMAREAQERADEREHRRRGGTPRHNLAQGPLRELQPILRRPRDAYSPRPDSQPGKVLAHLRTHGGYLSYAQVSSLFGIQQVAVTATLRAALQHGALVRHIVDQRVVLALPGFEPPPPAPQPSKELLSLEARLRRRVEMVAQLQAEIAAMQVRVALLVTHTTTQ